MMKPRLLHPLGEGRHSRRHRRRRGAHVAELVATAPEPTTLRVLAPDLDLRRVQEAGGPTDHASYSCACGYLFSADVSTSVVCPHCGTDQAW